MTSIAIHFRASSRVGSHQGHLFFRLIHQRRIKTIKTSYRVFPEEWNKEHQRFIFSKEDAHRLETLLKTEESLSCDVLRLKEIISAKMSKGSYQLEDIVDEYSISENSNHLLEFSKKLSAKLVVNKQERTARAYQTAARGLLRFCNQKDISLDQITGHLLKDYESWMKRLNKSANTISFYMRNLRAIYNKAVQEKRLPRSFESPFSQVYTGVKTTRKRALSKEDLSLLVELDLKTEPDETISSMQYNSRQSLNLAHKFFLFCFYARGMSFVDLAYLKKENIQKGVLYYYRKKTGQGIEVKMTKQMQQIIRYFEDEMKYSSFLFPIIRNPHKSERLQYESGLRMQNQRLKKLAELAKIDNRLSSHVARHTWASLAKQAHCPLSVISEALGHSNEKTTYIYLASFERSVLDRVNEQITKGFYRKQVLGSCPQYA